MAHVITADDCTGALESAAQCADAGADAVMTPWVEVDGRDQRHRSAATVRVIDLRSRHLPAAEAHHRMRAAVARHDVRFHKVDSTLRGNWPGEIAALVDAGRRVLMVPAFPAAGRVCLGGVVLEHGVPVDRTAHGSDARSPSLTSRPASLLPGAIELSDLAAVRRWVAGTGTTAVADAVHLDQVVELAAVAAHRPEVVLVGTAALVGAWAGGLGGARGAPLPPPVEAPVLVVCGSAHPVARAQLERLAAVGVPVIEPGDGTPSFGRGVVALTTSSNMGEGGPAMVVQRLARAAVRLASDMGAATIVVIGGDTAEAVVGLQDVRVTGSCGVGMAVGSVELGGRSMVLISKPGGFGGPDTVVDLMRQVLQ
jgi:D-threonate/D-erythronate kinase